VDLIAGEPGRESGSGKSARNCAGRGVAPEFYPQQFVYDAEHDLYLCPPAGNLSIAELSMIGRVERHEYRVATALCRNVPISLPAVPPKANGSVDE